MKGTSRKSSAPSSGPSPRAPISVVFAEQALSGTPALDLLCKTTFIELCEEALDEIASHCGRIAAVVGVPVLTECGTVSAAAVIQHGEVERCISKRFITARREMGFLVQGSGCETITDLPASGWPSSWGTT